MEFNVLHIIIIGLYGVAVCLLHCAIVIVKWMLIQIVNLCENIIKMLYYVVDMWFYN